MRPAPDRANAFAGPQASDHLAHQRKICRGIAIGQHVKSRRGAAQAPRLIEGDAAEFHRTGDVVFDARSAADKRHVHALAFKLDDLAHNRHRFRKARLGVAVVFRPKRDRDPV